MIEAETPLIEGALGDHDSQAMLGVVINSSKVHILLGSDHLIGLLLCQFSQGKKVLVELIILRIDLLQLKDAALVSLLFRVVGAEAECVLERAIHNFI